MISATAILAQTHYSDRLSGLRGAFTERKTDPADYQMILALIGGLVATCLLLMAIKHIKAAKSPERRHCPIKLFNRVVRRMGLKLIDRILLRLLVRAANRPQPVTLLFNRQTFDKHASLWVDSISTKPLRRYVGGRIEQIAKVAFDEPEPTDAPAPNKEPPPAQAPALT